MTYRACFAAICEDVEGVVRLLQSAITTSPVARQMAKSDTDFDLIRHDPRFQALLGD